MGVLPDHLGGAGDLLGGGVGAELERAGVDAQQRQAVAEDVVHLPGDLVAGALLGLLGPQLGLGLGPVGPVAQGQHQLAAEADEQAPADGGALDDQADHEQEPGRDPGLRPEHHVDERGHQAQDEDGRRGPRGPVDRDREHPHDHGPGHRLREGGEHHQHHGEPDRPAAAQPQPGAADRAGDHVGGEQPGRRRRGRLQPPADHQQREDHRGQEQQRVHDPVARAPPGPGPARRQRGRRRSVHPRSVPAPRAGLAPGGRERYRSRGDRYFRRPPPQPPATWVGQQIRPAAAIMRLGDTGPSSAASSRPGAGCAWR